jgi:hypothetical protein
MHFYVGEKFILVKSGCYKWPEAMMEVKQQLMQKLLYAILITTRKLKHYLLAHIVWVVSDRPLAHVLQTKEATGWIA